jgi:hypothetical protein
MFHDLRVVLLFENTTGTWLFQQKSVFHRCSLSNFWGSWKGLGTILAPSKVLEIQEQMCVCENINLLSHENTLIYDVTVQEQQNPISPRVHRCRTFVHKKMFQHSSNTVTPRNTGVPALE